MDTHTPRNRSQKLGIGGLALLACIAVALCVLAFSPKLAHAAVGDYGTLEDGTYVISSYSASTKGYSKSWDVAGGPLGAKMDCAKVQSYQSNETGAQRWRITTDSDGYSTIVNAQSGKALDAPGGTADDLEQLQIYTVNNADAQKWKIIEEEHGYKIVPKVDESFVIDLWAGYTADGTKIVFAGDNGNDNQRWMFERCTQDALNISDEQTEMFDTSVYVTDKQPAAPVVESVTDGWSVGTLSGDENVLGVYYSGGDYWHSYGAVIKVRYDKIGKVNGEWVSCRLTFGSLRGNGITSMTGHWVLPNGKEGSGIRLNDDFWSGILYFGLYQVNCTMEMFNTETGEQVDLTGSYISWGSLNGSPGYSKEGVNYLSDSDYTSYVLESNNLGQKSDGTWRGESEEGFTDGIGKPGATKNMVSYRIADATPKFQFSVEGGRNAQWVSFNFSPFTIATPPSPTKGATITG